MSQSFKQRLARLFHRQANINLQSRKHAGKRLHRLKLRVFWSIVLVCFVWAMIPARPGYTQRNTTLVQRPVAQPAAAADSDDDCAPAPNPLFTPRERLQQRTDGKRRGLRATPAADVQDVSVQILDRPTREGNVRVRVQLEKNENTPAQISVPLEDRQLILRDDGRGGDERAGDGIFSGITNVNLQSVQRQQEKLRAMPQEQLPVFINREEVRTRERSLELLQTLRPGGIIKVPPVPGNPANIDPERSLMIRHPGVVQDPTRTRTTCTGSSMGKWSFGYLMQQMANTPVSGISASDFTLRWLKRWMFDQNINDWTVAKRTAIQNLIITPWQAASGGPNQPLDLSKAPFRLLAIVNRVDLRQNLVYGGGSAGEARFVFGAIGPNCQVLPFTVIFEYGIKKKGCPDLKAWAQQWKNLDTLPIGSPPFNAALEAITEQFAKANADPAKPNRSALNQLRTNEIALTGPWELREFQIFSTDSDAGHLREVTVKQTPDLSLNKTNPLAQYVNANATAIIQQKHTVPLEFPAGSHFLGGSALTPGGMFWDGPVGLPNASIPIRQARHMFSLQTCNGCHAGETSTQFLHVGTAPYGPSAVALSGFLTGINVPDPADNGNPVRTFNDLKRRATDLDSLINTPCVFQLTAPTLRMTH